MPVMDGMEVLQELQKKELDVLIVVLSGYQDLNTYVWPCATEQLIIY